MQARGKGRTSVAGAGAAILLGASIALVAIGAIPAFASAEAISPHVEKPIVPHLVSPPPAATPPATDPSTDSPAPDANAAAPDPSSQPSTDVPASPGAEDP